LKSHNTATPNPPPTNPSTQRPTHPPHPAMTSSGEAHPPSLPPLRPSSIAPPTRRHRDQAKSRCALARSRPAASAPLPHPATGARHTMLRDGPQEEGRLTRASSAHPVCRRAARPLSGALLGNLAGRLATQLLWCGSWRRGGVACRARGVRQLMSSVGGRDETAAQVTMEIETACDTTARECAYVCCMARRGGVTAVPHRTAQVQNLTMGRGRMHCVRV